MTETAPPRPKFVAYYRVSTEKQGKAKLDQDGQSAAAPQVGSGLGMEAQIFTVKIMSSAATAAS